jgi:hypothetical protein
LTERGPGGRGRVAAVGGRHARGIVLLLLAAFQFGPEPLRGQTSRSFTGQVTGPRGEPVPLARIQVTTDAGSRLEALTDSTGHFRLPLPDQGSLVVSVIAQRFVPTTRVIDGGDPVPGELRADFPLVERVVALEPVAVQVEPLSVASATRWVPGSSERSRPALAMRGEPLDADLVSELAARQPRAALVPTDDGPGLSIGGQAPDQTRYTLDGGDAGIAVPREAIRSASVLANTYDVGRGGFTGGQVNVQTQRGGNDWGGAVRMVGAPASFAFGPSHAHGGATASVDAGGGGAVVRDRLFLFAAGTLRRTDFPVRSIDALPVTEWSRVGLDSGEVERFLSLTKDWRPEIATRSLASLSDFATGLVRLDAVLSPRLTLLARLNHEEASSHLGAGATAVIGTGSHHGSGSTGFLTQLSAGSERLANELRVSWTHQSRRWAGVDLAPLGVVTLIDSAGDRGNAALRFAGSGVQPPNSEDGRLDLVHQFILTTRDGAHRFRLGMELGLGRHSSQAARDPGRFHFGSLDDLAAARPTSFTRSLHYAPTRATSTTTAAFLDDHWRAGSLQLSYGLRAERILHHSEGEVVPEVGALFGRDPGSVPSRWRLSPRIGFALDTRMPWDRGPHGRTMIQGGAGEFVGAVALRTLAPALAERGASGAADLTCIGEAAPVPNWTGYRHDPATIPVSCSDGNVQLATRVPRVTVFSPDYSPPRVRRASLDGRGVLRNGVVWGAGLSLLQGVRQPAARDLNLRAAPSFRLTSERGRSVFADPDAIASGGGFAAPAASRRIPAYGVVREISGTGRSRALQLSMSASQTFNPRRFLGWPFAGASYTWTDARETVSAVGALAGSPSSSGVDPFESRWAMSGHSPRHMLQLNAGTIRTRTLSFAVLSRVSSGVPYTPMVAGDVNGDGVLNDRAFIFDPGLPAADPHLRDGMRDLLGSAPGSVRSCLRGQLGGIAAHNSCRTGWSHAVDLHAMLRLGPTIGTSTHRRLSLWITAANITAGLDQLLHGAARLRGWGQYSRVDDRLLTIRGFDAASNQFRYVVNPAFGRAATGSPPQLVPFSLRIQMRLVVGVDRPLRAFEEMRDAMGDRARAYAPENVRLHIERQLTNVASDVLELNGPRRLHLSVDQARRLGEIAEQFGRRAAPLVDSLVVVVAGAHGAPSDRRMEAARRGLSQQAVALRRWGLERVGDVLTSEQWTALPITIRSPSSEFSPLPPERLAAPSGS